MRIFINSARAGILMLVLLVPAGCSDNPVETPPPLEADLQGSVADEDGNVFRGVETTLRRVGSADVLQQVTTDTQGRFSFDDLSEGNYEVAIEPPRLSEVMGANPAAVRVDGSAGAADFALRMHPSEALVIGRDFDPIDEIRNAAGGDPVDDGELLYHSNDPGQLHAITAPDGRHLTLGEWEQARGTGRVTCTPQGTRYRIELENLVPNGVYTVWNFVLDRTVTKNTFPSTRVANAGSLGPNTGDGNIFTASATGEGTLVVTAPPGAMSMGGQMPGCVLTEAPGSAAIVLYHIDGKTWGGTPGPNATWVGHLGIVF